MSYSIAYAAFRNVDKTALLEYFRLRDTGEHDLYNESPFSGGDLPSGWYLIWSNDLIWGADEKKFTELSKDAEIIVGIAEETTMTFVTSSFFRGEKVWSVVHDAQNNLRHLEYEGELPDSFDEIRQRNIALQDAVDETNQLSVDHYASIPSELFASITGFLYSHALTSGEQINFTALQEY